MTGRKTEMCTSFIGGSEFVMTRVNILKKKRTGKSGRLITVLCVQECTFHDAAARQIFLPFLHRQDVAQQSDQLLESNRL